MGGLQAAFGRYEHRCGGVYHISSVTDETVACHYRLNVAALQPGEVTEPEISIAHTLVESGAVGIAKGAGRCVVGAFERHGRDVG